MIICLMNISEDEKYVIHLSGGNSGTGIHIGNAALIVIDGFEIYLTAIKKSVDHDAGE